MKPHPEPVPGQPPPLAEPDDGNAISTVRVTRTEDAYVAVEHPEGWTEVDVRAALAERAIDFGAVVQFWSAERRTRLRAVALGVNDPDDPAADPFQLGEDEDEDDDDTGDGAGGDAPAAGGVA